MNSNLILVGGVQQVDPKEIGIQPTEVRNPIKGSLIVPAKATDTQSAKHQEVFKPQTRGKS